MSTPEERFGTDLRLLRDPTLHDSRAPGEDLGTRARPERVPAGAAAPDDLATWTGVDNLAQALLLRLLTWRGELTRLGHPAYGSRLHELIGELNDESTRSRAKLYVLQALAGEPRVARVVSVTVTASRRVREQIDIALVLETTAADAPPLLLTLPFSLAGGAA